MKLFDGGRAPNPRRVRIFLAEKGITVALAPVDMAAMEHRSEPVTSRNPLQRLPVLELDDGTVLCESVAICRYFEELHPQPPLFGSDPLQRAQVEMWQRRIEFGLLSTVAAAFRHIHPAMVEWEVPQVSAWGEANKPKAIEFMTLLDRHLEGSRFAAGDDYTIADITGLVALDFAKPARIVIPDDLRHLHRWYGELKTRPSAAA